MQSFRQPNPVSVTAEPERSAESKDDPCEAMTSIHLSFHSRIITQQNILQTDMETHYLTTSMSNKKRLRSLSVIKKIQFANNAITWRAQSRKAFKEALVRQWEKSNSLKICWVISLDGIEKDLYLSTSRLYSSMWEEKQMREIPTKHVRESKYLTYFINA